MKVHRVRGLWGATGRLHGPYWLWASQGKRPVDARPAGEVNINFDYRGYLPSPIAIKLAVLDERADAFLQALEGGDIVVASSIYERAFLFQRVPPSVRTSPTCFELLVQEYEHIRPIPDAFEWPRPAPTEEEVEAARREEFARERRLIMTDPGMVPMRRNATGRRIRRSASTR